jgi:hypothetical protein
MPISIMRRRVLTSLPAAPLALAAPAILHAQTAPRPTLSASEAVLPVGSTMSFFDEFMPVQAPKDATNLDYRKWTNAIWYETSSGPTNYKVSRSSYDGRQNTGFLRIWPQPVNGKFINRTFDTDPYNTKNARSGSGYAGFTQLYGFFEMRARMPRGVGPWPAFWLFNHFDDVRGSRRPEIDILEAYPGEQNPDWANTSTHEAIRAGASAWDPAGSLMGSQFNPVTLPAGWKPLNQVFNTFGLWWDQNVINFYLNSTKVYSIVNQRTTSTGTTIALNEPLYLILDLWFGSGSGVPSTNQALTPIGESNAYEVDYVRVWPHA